MAKGKTKKNTENLEKIKKVVDQDKIDPEDTVIVIPKKHKPQRKPRTTHKPLTEEQLRAIALYLGDEGGIAFKNQTQAYAIAHGKGYLESRVKDENGNIVESKEHRDTRVYASKFFRQQRVQAVLHDILLHSQYHPDNIKKRFAELSIQNLNLPVALSATEKIAKIEKVINDSTKVDIPQLSELTDTVKKILGS